MHLVQSCVVEVCRAVRKEGRKGHRHVSRSVLIDGMLGIRHWGIDYVLVIVKGALKNFVYTLSNMFGLCSRGWCNIEHDSDISLVPVIVVGLSR